MIGGLVSIDKRECHETPSFPLPPNFADVIDGQC